MWLPLHSAQFAAEGAHTTQVVAYSPFLCTRASNSPHSPLPLPQLQSPAHVKAAPLQYCSAKKKEKKKENFHIDNLEILTLC